MECVFGCCVWGFFLDSFAGTWPTSLCISPCGFMHTRTSVCTYVYSCCVISRMCYWQCVNPLSLGRAAAWRADGRDVILLSPSGHCGMGGVGCVPQPHIWTLLSPDAHTRFLSGQQFTGMLNILFTCPSVCPSTCPVINSIIPDFIHVGNLMLCPWLRNLHLLCVPAAVESKHERNGEVVCTGPCRRCRRTGSAR